VSQFRSQRIIEQFIHFFIWFTIFLFPFISGFISLKNGYSESEVTHMIIFSYLSILPFFLLFLLNNCLFVPKLLFKKKYYLYLLFVLVSIFFLVSIISSNGKGMPKYGQKSNSAMAPDSVDGRYPMFDTHRDGMRPNDSFYPDKHLKPFPFPPFLFPFLLALVVIACNIGIKMLFKSQRDDVVLKELERQNLQNELQYLRYQINPHFFMNTLNNIHALVDIDTEKAKKTIVELSKLMRYVLYEANNKEIHLSKEIQFLENYIALMSIRYTENVTITVKLPQDYPDVMIPPLLFVSFVENAFKHGVSYQNESFVSVIMQFEEDNRLAFYCSNSNKGKHDDQHHGIGMENINKRLELLYGNNYTLSVNNTQESFDVTLIIPIQE